MEVKQLAALIKSGRSLMDIAGILYGERSAKAKQKVHRQVNKFTKLYPRVFGAIAK